MIGQKLGNFEIIDEIGRGGMGVVYRAQQVSLDRIVALKVLPKGTAHSETSAERFHREALAMAKLSHPNIVDVIEVGERDGVHYFAMQMVEGPSLTELIRQGPGIPAERAAEMAAQVADALAHAHEQGIVHRDIKPDNILLDLTGRAVVTDFGIARTAEDTSLTQTGATIGTPDYMSPEVLRGNPLDGRTDIYSLGVVLFQMVTGRVPFTATTPFDVANRHLIEPPPRPRSLASHCPEWLESIILKALAKQPAERFSSAAEMAAVLRAAKPVAAPTMEFAAPTATTPGQVQTPGPRADSSSPARSLVWTLAGVGALMLALGLGFATLGGGGESGGPDESVSEIVAGPLETTTDFEASPEPQPQPPPQSRRIAPVGAVASSVLDGRSKYQPSKAIDGRRDTSWVEGASGPGLGEWISVELSTLVTVTEVALIVGYDKCENDSYGDRWSLNNRITYARLVFDDGTTIGSSFDPMDRGFQSVQIEPPARSRYVRIEIVDVIRGTHRDWNDTCVSEVRVMGYTGQISVITGTGGDEGP